MQRLQRVYRRSGSVRNFIAMIREELLVRVWSSPTARKLITPFVSDYTPPKWIFLVGCYNSGTTILQKILNSHPEISGLPREGVRFTEVLSNLEEHSHHMIWSEDFLDYVEPKMTDAAALEQLKKDWGVFWQVGSSALLEKSVASTARIEWLSRVFPEAIFIGIHRNGYCVTEGLRRRANPPEWLVEKTGTEKYSFETVANQWACANEMMLDAFAALPDSKTHLIAFEHFVKNPAEAVNGILDFVGVDSGQVSFDSGQLQLFGNRFEIRDPNPASLTRLDAGSKNRVAPQLEPMMKRLGYSG